MRSPCAGVALDPPLWIVPNKALSHTYSLSLHVASGAGGAGPRRAGARDRSSVWLCVCVYYCSTYYKAVRVGGWG
jgi:hypothetical protein